MNALFGLGVYRHIYPNQLVKHWCVHRTSKWLIIRGIIAMTRGIEALAIRVINAMTRGMGAMTRGIIAMTRGFKALAEGHQ